MNGMEITSFGEWVQKRRNQLRYSRRKFADLVGCAPVTIKKIERDERRPSAQMAELLAEHLQLPESEIEKFLQRANGQFIATMSDPIELSFTEIQAQSNRPNEPKHNLPAQVTSFVGRTAEINETVTALKTPNCRLMTIIGSGGMGKTRLSLAVATELIDTFTEGVTFVPLAAVDAADGPDKVSPLLGAISDQLKLSFYGEDAPKLQLLNHLRRKEQLLVLDNLEHLLDHVGLIGEILAAAPDIKILATSRERLNVQGEWLFQLQGLPLNREQEEQNGAVDLFVQRATQIIRHFKREEEMEAVLRICALVEGMPLGLELAAAWVAQLSCAEIVTEIERELDFLSSNQRHTNDRHRSLRAVFTASWQRLSAAEQLTLKQLSLFRGGFLREAAIEVADASLRLLAALVDKSMIRRNDNGRYEIHELMRQFASEKLDADQELAGNAVDKHGRYYLHLLRELGAKYAAGSSDTVFIETAADIDNNRLAWQWGVEQREVELLIDAVWILSIFFESYGWYLEGAERFQHAYKTLEPLCRAQPHSKKGKSADINCLLVAGLYTMAGNCHLRRGRVELAVEMIKEGVEKIDPTTDFAKRTLGWLKMDQCNAVIYRGDFVAARRIAEEGIKLHQDGGEQGWTSTLLYNVAALSAELAGDYQDAKEIAKQGSLLARKIGNPIQLGFSSRILGRLALVEGEFEKAETYLQTATTQMEQLAVAGQLMIYLYDLGDAARLAGKLELARQHYERGLAMSSERNTPTAIASGYWGLGNLAVAEGNYGVAEACFAKSQQIGTQNFWTPGGPGWLAIARGEAEKAKQIFQTPLSTIIQFKQAPRALDTLGGLAHAEALSGRLEEALALIALVQFHRSSSFESKMKVEKLYEELKAELPAATFATAVAQGQQFDLWETCKRYLRVAIDD